MIREKALIAVLTGAAAIIAFQLFVPPVTGLADQGDFIRTIRRFGYRPLHGEKLLYTYVEPKYVPDPQSRNRYWEQANTEYLFVAAALLLNKVVSRDGAIDITVAGFVHALAFLAALTRLLWVTRRLPGRIVVWITALLILTDAAYVGYFNSWYQEPASCIFFLLLLAEGIEIGGAAKVSTGGMLRWSIWATLFVFAKPQNAPIGLLVALFTIRLVFWTASRCPRLIAIAGIAAMLVCAAYNVMAVPAVGRMANTYGLIFSGILPESHDRAADLQALGLDARFASYSGTGAWTPDTAFTELAVSGDLRRVGSLDILRFYLLRPARFWRRLHGELPKIMYLRFSWYGNYEPSAGFKPAAQSRAFTVWSAVHEHVLAHVTKWMVFALVAWPLIAAWRWFHAPSASVRRRIELATLLPLSCLTALLTAVFGDAFDLIKHLYLFNLLLDASMVYLAGTLAAYLMHARR